MGSSRPLLRVVCLFLILMAGCGPRYKIAPETPLLSASLKDLVDRLEERERSIQTLRALLTIRPTDRPAVTGSLSFSRSTDGGPPSLRLKGFDPLGGTLFDLTSVGDRVRVTIPGQQRIFEGALDELNDPSLPVRAVEVQRLVSTAVGPLIESEEVPILERLETTYLVHLVRVSGGEGRLTKRLWFERGHLRLVRVELFGDNDRFTDHGDGESIKAAVEFDDYQDRAGIDWPGRMTIRPTRSKLPDASDLTLEFREIHLNSGIPPEEFRLP